jgi:hypothetical protein
MMTSISTMIAMMPLVIGNIGPGAGEASRLGCWSNYTWRDDNLYFLYVVCDTNNVPSAC